MQMFWDLLHDLFLIYFIGLEIYLRHTWQQFCWERKKLPEKTQEIWIKEKAENSWRWAEIYVMVGKKICSTCKRAFFAPPISLSWFVQLWKKLTLLIPLVWQLYPFRWHFWNFSHKSGNPPIKWVSPPHKYDFIEIRKIMRHLKKKDKCSLWMWTVGLQEKCIWFSHPALLGFLLLRIFKYKCKEFQEKNHAKLNLIWYKSLCKMLALFSQIKKWVKLLWYNFSVTVTERS